ncbi:MAG: hypothetical protein J7K00_03030 [Candidatus Diapherotrites archaeon]|nr:hypothetical protein [Candidatus Diapherotrites archaeon]
MNDITTVSQLQTAMETNKDITPQMTDRTPAMEAFWNLLNKGQILPCGAPTEEKGNDRFVLVLRNPRKLTERDSKKTKSKMTGIWREHNDPKSTINVQIAGETPVKLRIGKEPGIVPNLKMDKWETSHENLLLLCKNPDNPRRTAGTNSFLLIEFGKTRTKNLKHHHKNSTLAMLIGRLVVVSDISTLRGVKELADQFKEKIVWIGKNKAGYIVAYLNIRTVAEPIKATTKSKEDNG